MADIDYLQVTLKNQKQIVFVIIILNIKNITNNNNVFAKIITLVHKLIF